MSKPAKKRTPKAAAAKAVASLTSLRAKAASSGRVKIGEKDSKQSRIIGMLQSPNGTTIAAVVEATGWQQHSVRGFFAGVVQKKLRLKLNSEKIDGKRVYQIVAPSTARSRTARSRSRMA
jgi:pyrroline-5-carboxylate reductase